MHRRVVQAFLSVPFRPGFNVRLPVRWNFNLMKNTFHSKPPACTSVATETNSDFSALSPDIFGTLSRKKNIHEKLEELPEEEDESSEFDFTNEEGRKNRRPLEYYEDLIKNLLKEKKLVEALDVLETRMLKKDKVEPRYYVHNLLINGCAVAGYCEKAFQLYQKMKERQIKRTPATYTGLFNACANSPFPEDARKKLSNLRKSLAENGVELTQINYNAMIKAYARLKDSYSAFLVADEMCSKGFSLNDNSCAFLLQACISDTEAGLRHALLLWHKMREKNVTPTIHLYNLFIRCTRDCGFGTEEDLKNTLQYLIAGKRVKNNLIESGEPKDSWPITISWNSNTSSSLSESMSAIRSEAKEKEIIENKPNLLAPIPQLGSLLPVKNVETASDRLLLLGGFKTVLEQMKADEVKPDIKTFTLLLDVLPSSVVAEEHLLKEMNDYGVYIDIDFCNMLMKKRAMRGDYLKSREVLELIQSNYLNPDIVTFGILAFSCNKIYEAEELIYEMKEFGYRLNMPILGAMLKKGCHSFNFRYVIYIMNLTKKLRIPVSEEYMKILQDLEEKMSNILRKKKKKDINVPEFMNNPKFLESYNMWKEFYDRFQYEVQRIDIPHPYKQFQKPKNVEENVETYEKATEPIRNENVDKKTPRKFKFSRKANENVDEWTNSLTNKSKNDNADAFFEEPFKYSKGRWNKRKSQIKRSENTNKGSKNCNTEE